MRRSVGGGRTQAGVEPARGALCELVAGQVTDAFGQRTDDRDAGHARQVLDVARGSEIGVGRKDPTINPTGSSPRADRADGQLGVVEGASDGEQTTTMGAPASAATSRIVRGRRRRPYRPNGPARRRPLDDGDVVGSGRSGDRGRHPPRSNGGAPARRAATSGPNAARVAGLDRTDWTGQALRLCARGRQARRRRHRSGRASPRRCSRPRASGYARRGAAVAIVFPTSVEVPVTTRIMRSPPRDGGSRPMPTCSIAAASRSARAVILNAKCPPAPKAVGNSRRGRRHHGSGPPRPRRGAGRR